MDQKSGAGAYIEKPSDHTQEPTKPSKWGVGGWRVGTYKEMGTYSGQYGLLLCGQLDSLVTALVSVS